MALMEDGGLENALTVAVDENRPVTGDVKFDLRAIIAPVLGPGIDILFRGRIREKLIEIHLVAEVLAAKNTALAISTEGRRMGRVEAHVAPGDDVEGLFNLQAGLAEHAVMIFEIITHE